MTTAPAEGRNDEEHRDPRAGTGPDRSSQESHQQRVNRELIELLNELRVALPGVQVLFAFMLSVPFQQGFQKIDELQRGVFICAFVTTAVATILLMAPTAYHRLRFRDGDKERMLGTANRLAIIGMAFLAVALGLVTFLVCDLIVSDVTASLITSGVVVLVTALWFGLPLSRRVRDGGR